MSFKIITNNLPRFISFRHQVPEKVLADQFSHLDDDNIDGFFCYKGDWFHISDFMPTIEGRELQDWDGYTSDTYFSGTVIKWVDDDDGESLIVGRYLS